MHSLWVILLLAAWAINICTARHKYKSHHPNQDSVYCFSEEEMENNPSRVLHHFVSSKMHWERYSAVNLVSKVEENERRRKRRRRAAESTCPDLKSLEEGSALNERSISPWTYRIDTDESRYPQKLAFAHCLCDNCISSESGKETSSLNSLLVRQTMLVLRKKRCLEARKFTFELEYISVPVACTCSVPRY